MRKIIPFFIILSFISVGVITNIETRRGSNYCLTMDNIEALASGEDNTPVIKCPGGNRICAKVTDSSGEKKFYKGN